MKTTIELPDALAQRARDVARRQHTTLRELVVAGLQSELDRRARTARVDFVFTTVDGDGLRADVRPEQMTEMAYDLP
jgi:hypothetical protein